MDGCGALGGALAGLASSLAALVLGRGAAEVVRLGRRRYRVARQLGEGGFSQVLLVADEASGAQYALKKIVCHQGTEALAMARREIGAGRRFAHPNIVPLVDHAVADGGPALPGAQVAYMVFPVYRRGSLFDLVRDAEDVGRALDESFVVHVFRGVCAAVQYLHAYNRDGSDGAGYSAPSAHPLSSVELGNDNDNDNDNDDDGDGDGSQEGYPPPRAGGGYAHRDIKLGNVMLADDGATPVLMDFGSVRPARTAARTRVEALQIQDDAAESCTMPYRAPELFDVQRGAEIDERVDVWSLGCLLFALAYGHTPFEGPAMGPGASIALAAVNAKYAFPDPDPHSDRIRRLVGFMLVPDPQRRPFVDQVVALLDELYPLSSS
ncbi:Serine/threonine-protein kinase env7 [Coemansia javaensis]|uniref:non-specific serine/threonine protein kinase n=1 Tax=Coemansia javaensis TaxID=2761396 RepID=A0A9W8LHP2_9FUNG|nr:Serine/threonine-protein kinase env7 [Coemansia javaensis]